MIISFSGVDNSGKTTLAKLLYEELSKKYSCKYRAEFDIFLLGKIKKLLGQKKLLGLTNSVILDRKITLKSQIFYFIYFLLILAHHIGEYVYYELIFQKKILVRERYFYDFCISIFINTGTKVYLNFISFFPRSFLNIYLDVGLDKIVERGKSRDFLFPENHYKELIKQYNLYGKFFYSIKANKDIYDLHQDVTRVVNLKNKLLKISSIKISGIDGAGKSTTIENLEKEFQQLNIRYVKIHFYYNYIIIKFLGKFRINSGKKDKTIAEYNSSSIENEQKSKNKNKPLWWKVFVIVDALIQYVYINIIGFNKIKLYDRYFLDYKVSWDFLGVTYSDKLFKFLGKDSQNYFVLLADAETLYNRKPEHTEKFFEETVRVYEKLSQDFNLQIIDTQHLSPNKVITFIFNKYTINDKLL